MGAEFQFQGVLGFLSRDAAGAATQALLVGGTHLAAPDLTIEAETGEYRRQIASVDHAAGEIVLDQPLPAGMNLAGSAVVIGSADRARVYPIASVAADGAATPARQVAAIRGNAIVLKP